MKKYVLTVTEVDTETNESRELIKAPDNEFLGVTVIADRDGERGVFAMYHENILGLASKLASEERSMMACRLAVMVEDHKKNMSEEELLDSILGGIQ